MRVRLPRLQVRVLVDSDIFKIVTNERLFNVYHPFFIKKNKKRKICYPPLNKKNKWSKTMWGRLSYATVGQTLGLAFFIFFLCIFFKTSKKKKRFTRFNMILKYYYKFYLIFNNIVQLSCIWYDIITLIINSLWKFDWNCFFILKIFKYILNIILLIMMWLLILPEFLSR
jgi:hypothetical protein